MCGFGGVINSNTNWNRRAIARISQEVSHRGPDSTGLALFNESFLHEKESGATALFFNRLAIIDLDARSDQPFQDDDHVLMFNGEIYNYVQIRHDLEKSGVVFLTASDTEVLFHALKRWGKDVIPKLNGMFAFIWIDKKSQRFILARDRAGIKPLYYKVEDEAFIFASDLYSVVRLSRRSADISTLAIHQYLQLQYVPAPNSILQEVHKLPPGHYIEMSVKSLQQQKPIQSREYWDSYRSVSEESNPRQGELEAILVRSIERQLVADVPLGLFLSSGIDSSLLTAIINKHFKGKTFDFFTVGFSEATTSDESDHALAYLKGFRNPLLKHHRLSIDSRLVSQKLSSLYDYYDEPFGDHASLLNWVISEEAKKHVTVVLSGDGADELFWGYSRYNKWREQSRSLLRNIPGLRLTSAVARLMPSSRFKFKLIEALETDPTNRYLNLVTPTMFRFLPAVQPNKDIWFLAGLDALKNRQDLPSIIDFKSYLADAMLYKVDRSSMAASLEVRVPYLDNEVIDFALQLPLQSKSTSEFENKAPLKRVLGELAPHYDLQKPKKGFNFPLGQWLHTEWKEFTMDTITRKNLESLDLDSKPFLKLLNTFYSGGDHCTVEVWHLLNLVLWHRKFQDVKLKR